MVDTGNKRIEKFSGDGTLMSQWDLNPDYGNNPYPNQVFPPAIDANRTLIFSTFES